MSRKVRWIFWIICIFLIGMLIYLPGGGEWYARNIYPIFYNGLSFFSSFFSFSLNDAAIVLLVMGLLAGLLLSKGFKSKVCFVLEFAAFVFIWVYGSWCLNYSRDDFYKRTGLERQPFSEERFECFLNNYAVHLNENYCEIDTINYTLIDQIIKEEYKSLNPKYGLLKPSGRIHPKPMLFNAYMSSVGVLGYIGPLFIEYHLNKDLLPVQYASVYAHEMSHVLGISNEAEANFYGYKICTESPVKEIRFSGYFGLFPYVYSRAIRFWPKDKVREWLGTIRPEIVELFWAKNKHWQALRKPLLDQMQGKIYDLHLKTNGIRTGLSNYGEVIGLIIASEDAESYLD